MEPARILLYRLGGLGDFTVALPLLHLIDRRYPGSQRILLTNYPGDARAPAAREILEGSGLVHDYVQYPVFLRRPSALRSLARRLRSVRADLLVYMMVPGGRLRAFRDSLFFRAACGIRHQVGVPTDRASLDYQWRAEKGRFEHETERLARCLSSLGEANPADPDNWDLRLTARERETARAVLAAGGMNRHFVGCSIGTKFPTNDWGLQNWRVALGRLASRFPELGLVLLGSDVESAPSEIAAAEWPSNRRVNLCGRLSPRVSAAVLQDARVYLGHDSGPIHLAASVGTPCVGVYSARHRPGPWFPYGHGHRVLYHQTDCFDCGLVVCERFGKKCITSIDPSELVDAAVSSLQPRLERCS